MMIRMYTQGVLPWKTRSKLVPNCYVQQSDIDFGGAFVSVARLSLIHIIIAMPV